MKFQDDISNMNTYIHTDKPKPICPPLFQSWGHKKHCTTWMHSRPKSLLLLFLQELRTVRDLLIDRVILKLLYVHTCIV